MQDLIDIALEGGWMKISIDRPCAWWHVPTERIAAPGTVGRNHPSGTSLQSSHGVKYVVGVL